MKKTFLIMQAVFVDFFFKNLKTLFLEEDAISAEVIKEDKENKSIWIDIK